MCIDIICIYLINLTNELEILMIKSIMPIPKYIDISPPIVERNVIESIFGIYLIYK